MTVKQLSPEGEEIVTEGNAEAEADVETQQEDDEASNTETEESDKETEEPEKEPVKAAKSAPTVPLSDYSNLKDIVSRMIGEDPDKLLEIAEADPKLAARIKAQFPKRFKDVTLTHSVSDEDFDTRVAQAVKAELEAAGNLKALKGFKDKLGMTEIEFSDIKNRLDAKAKSLVKSETADNYEQALNLALQIIEPDLYEEMETDKVTTKVAERIRKASGGSSKSKKTDKGSEMSAMEEKFNKNLPPTYKV